MARVRGFAARLARAGCPTLARAGAAVKEGHRAAAVLVPLVDVEGGGSGILYTLRTSSLSSHGGEVCFPGGRVDAGETAEQAAVREAREELGHPGMEVEVLGTLPTVPGAAGQAVTPVLGFLPGLQVESAHAARCRDEVEAVFVVPLASLAEPRRWERHGEYKLPVYAPAEAEGARIWGLTAFVTYGVMKDVLRAP